MGKAKWIAGFLGWVAFGPIGALLGFLTGSFIDVQIDVAKRVSGSGGNTTGTGYGPRAGYSPNEQRNSFMVSLLVLSSAVIKADGQVRQAELDQVRSISTRSAPRSPAI